MKFVQLGTQIKTQCEKKENIQKYTIDNVAVNWPEGTVMTAFTRWIIISYVLNDNSDRQADALISYTRRD